LIDILIEELQMFKIEKEINANYQKQLKKRINFIGFCLNNIPTINNDRDIIITVNFIILYLIFRLKFTPS